MEDDCDWRIGIGTEASAGGVLQSKWESHETYHIT
jgi:hypothetical protein